MLRQGSGQIVVVSSLLGKFGIGHRSAYSASKHAVQGFFDSLLAEVHQRGVRITIACPGAVRTSAFDQRTLRRRDPLRQDGRVPRAGADTDRGAERILRGVARQRSEVYPAKLERWPCCSAASHPLCSNAASERKDWNSYPRATDAMKLPTP